MGKFTANIGYLTRLGKKAVTWSGMSFHSSHFALGEVPKCWRDGVCRLTGAV